MRKFNINYLLLTGILSVSIFLSFFIFKKNTRLKLSAECDKTITTILAKAGINNTHLTYQSPYSNNIFKLRPQIMEKQYLIPENYSWEKIKKLFANNRFAIGKIYSKKTKTEESLILDFYFKKLQLYRLILRKKIPAKILKGKLAIVLDDWGYNRQIFAESLELKIPLTYAILPGLSYSAEIAEKLHACGYEFILHLPMQPHSSTSKPMEKNTILTTMSKEEIVQIMKKIFLSLPQMKGVNNHMGSLATENEYTMNIILDEIKNNNLYFLDSRVSGKSVAEKIAGEKKLPFLKRDVFIDDINDPESIKNQLVKAKNIAITTGKAIAIGHAKHLTISILKEIIPQLQKEGIQFIYLSELFDAIDITSQNDTKNPPISPFVKGGN